MINEEKEKILLKLSELKDYLGWIVQCMNFGSEHVLFKDLFNMGIKPPKKYEIQNPIKPTFLNSGFKCFSLKKEYEKELELNKQRKYYNEVQFPKEELKYNTIFNNEFERRKLYSEYSLPVYKAKVKSFESFLSRKYHSGEMIDILIEYLKDNRADTLKEAINLMVSEKREEEFRQDILEEERNRTEEMARYNEQVYEHNQKMEEYAQKQAYELQRQTDIAKQQIYKQEAEERRKRIMKPIDFTKCLSCKKFNTCSRTTCTGFVGRGA